MIQTVNRVNHQSQDHQMTMNIKGDEGIKSIESTTKKRVGIIIPGARMKMTLMTTPMKVTTWKNERKSRQIQGKIDGDTDNDGKYSRLNNVAATKGGKDE